MFKIILLHGCEDCPYVEFTRDWFDCEYLKTECPHEDGKFIDGCPLRLLPEAPRMTVDDSHDTAIFLAGQQAMLRKIIRGKEDRKEIT